MLILLGGSGYVGSAFARFFDQRKIDYCILSRKNLDYYQPDQLKRFLKEQGCTFLINAAGYTGKPNVDSCELNRTECLIGNSVLPGLIRSACEDLGIAWGHVSSGCIYTGARPDGGGFREADAPNFDFRHNNCSFYSGCKALGEECLVDAKQLYVWRLRIPFDHQDSARNYISKLMRYDRLLEARNSISQLDEFVKACWECWSRRVPFGIYNVTNTGSITTSEIVDMMRRILNVSKSFQFFESEAQFMQLAARTPRSNCVLDNRKLTDTGIGVSEVHDAVEKALRNWISEWHLDQGVSQ